MSSKKCPQCGLTNFADALACKRCTADLTRELTVAELPSSRPEPTIAQQAASETAVALTNAANVQFSAGNVLGMLVWLGASAAFALLFFALQSDLRRATSAPQECAAAAINVGYAIIIYCIARGLTLMIRIGQGK